MGAREEAESLTSRIIEGQLTALRERLDKDDSVRRELKGGSPIPRTNVPRGETIARDLTKLEVEPAKPKPKIRSKQASRPSAPEAPDLEPRLQYVPEEIVPEKWGLPGDFGYDYVQGQIVDLAWQLCRLTDP